MESHKMPIMVAVVGFIDVIISAWVKAVIVQRQSLVVKCKSVVTFPALNCKQTFSVC